MSKKATLNTKVFKADELNAAEYNPRKELQKGDLEYKQLKKSIEEFSYVDPLIYNEKTKTLISGHQRLKVLKDLGYTEIEVNCVELDEQKEKALNIALNKIHGDWANDKLSELIKELTAHETFDIDVIGFTQESIDDLLSDFDTARIFEDIPFMTDFEDGGKKGQTINKLIFGKHKIPLSEEESQKLENAYNKYVQKNGVEFGFVNYFLGDAV